MKKNKSQFLNQAGSTFIPILMCILLGLLVGFIILLGSNASQALNGFKTILVGGFTGGSRGVGNVFYYATPIMMTGLGVAFGFKTGVFNIGGPGQFIVGGFLASYLAVNLPFGGPLRWIIPVAAAAIGGALWAGISGLLNAYFKVNIVISTIMLNYIGMYSVNYLVKQTIFDSSKNAALPIPAPARLPRMGLDRLFPGSSANMGIIIAIFMVIIVYILLKKTTKGYELVACGLNPEASRLSGMNSKSNIILSMAISGALVGMGGALMYLSDSGRNIQVIDTLAAEGFNGIPVALLAMNHPIGVIFSAIFIAYITVAGFYMQTYRFAPEIIDIVIAVIIYFSAFSLIFRQYFEKASLGRAKHKKPKQGGNSE